MFSARVHVCGHSSQLYMSVANSSQLHMSVVNTQVSGQYFQTTHVYGQKFPTTHVSGHNGYNEQFKITGSYPFGTHLHVHVVNNLIHNIASAMGHRCKLISKAIFAVGIARIYQYMGRYSSLRGNATHLIMWFIIMMLHKILLPLPL